MTVIIFTIFEAFEYVGKICQVKDFDPPEAFTSTVFPEGIPMGQDRRISTALPSLRRKNNFANDTTKINSGFLCNVF